MNCTHLHMIFTKDYSPAKLRANSSCGLPEGGKKIPKVEGKAPNLSQADDLLLHG